MVWIDPETGTETFPKLEPEPEQIVSVPQHCSTSSYPYDYLRWRGSLLPCTSTEHELRASLGVGFSPYRTGMYSVPYYWTRPPLFLITCTWYPMKAFHVGQTFVQVEYRLHIRKSPGQLAVLWKGRESAKKLTGLKQIGITICKYVPGTIPTQL